MVYDSKYSFLILIKTVVIIAKIKVLFLNGLFFLIFFIVSSIPI